MLYLVWSPGCWTGLMVSIGRTVGDGGVGMYIVGRGLWIIWWRWMGSFIGYVIGWIRGGRGVVSGDV